MPKPGIRPASARGLHGHCERAGGGALEIAGGWTAFTVRRRVDASVRVSTPYLVGVPPRARLTVQTEHRPENAMDDADEIERFYDRSSELMRALLEELATAADTPRTFPEVEDALAWPRRRIASVLGGVWHLRTTEFGGRRPYRFIGEDRSSSGRWEIWCDSLQSQAIRAAQAGAE